MPVAFQDVQCDARKLDPSLLDSIEKRALCRGAKYTAEKLAREEVLAAPVMPNAAAAAAVVKRYEITHKAYTIQSDAISELKGRLLATLDQAALRVVEQPVHGALLLSITDILNALRAEYGRMTNRELSQLKNRWTAMKWDASTDLISFMAEFNEAATFLHAHGFAPSEGDQMVTLQDAVAHVPSFTQEADQAFYLAYPNVAQQTLANLCTVYREVYRRSNLSRTVAQHHTINQAVNMADTSTRPNTSDDVVLNGIMASARASLRDTVLTQDMVDKLLLEIPRTIQRCLRGTTIADPTPAQPRPPRSAPMPKLRKGICPLHQNGKHTWEQCRRNPDNEKM